MRNLQMATENVRNIPTISRLVERRFRVENVAEIIVGPNGVGIRHRAYDAKNPSEQYDNKADIRWMHEHDVNDVQIQGHTKVRHLASSAGVVPIYNCGGNAVMIDCFADGHVLIRVIVKEQTAKQAPSHQFAVRLNGSAPMDATSHDLDGAIAEAQKLIAAAPGRGNEVMVFVRVSDQLAGPVWQNIKA